MSDLASIQKKQAEAAKAAEKMVEEKDPQKILEMAAEMGKKAAELQKMALAFQAAMSPQEVTGKETQVKLTPDQKERVTQQTGVGLEEITLHDTKKRSWSRDFPLGKVEAREIEKEATKEAARLRLISDTRTEVEKIIKILEKLNVPELKETIEELRRDPTLGRGKSQPK